MKVNKACLADLNNVVDENLVYRGSDRDGDILVLDYAGMRVLTFGSIYEQSAYYPDRPFALVHEYTRAMMMVLGFLAPRHVTVLGLGGGTLLRSAHHYLPQCRYHVVEKRSVVYDIAKAYFGIPDDTRVQVSIGDAMRLLKTANPSSTDIIFSDLYDEYGVSQTQTERPFYRECARALTSAGWLVVNCGHRPDRDSALLKTLHEYFNEIVTCRCALGNHVIFACKASSVSYEQAERRLAQFEKAFDEPYVSLFRRLARVSA